MEKLKKIKNKNHISIAKQSFPEFSQDSVYQEILADIKKRYQIARFRAAHAVNQELIQYWHLDKQIVKKQTQAIWRSKFLEQLSYDLQSAFPESSGISVRKSKVYSSICPIIPRCNWEAACFPKIKSKV